MNINTTKCQLGISYLSTKSLIRFAQQKKKLICPASNCNQCIFHARFWSRTVRVSQPAGRNRKWSLNRVTGETSAFCEKYCPTIWKLPLNWLCHLWGWSPWGVRHLDSRFFNLQRGSPPIVPISPHNGHIHQWQLYFTPEPWALQRQPTHFSKTRH